MPQIPCRLSHLIVDETQSIQTVVLKEVSGKRQLHIGIGTYEALAIQRLIHQETFPRPLTHDLFSDTVEALGGSLKSLHISTLDEEGTYFAQLVIQQEAKRIEIDCRPSDGLALILQTGSATITIADHLLSPHQNENDSEAGAE